MSARILFRFMSFDIPPLSQIDGPDLMIPLRFLGTRKYPVPKVPGPYLGPIGSVVCTKVQWASSTSSTTQTSPFEPRPLRSHMEIVASCRSFDTTVVNWGRTSVSARGNTVATTGDQYHASMVTSTGQALPTTLRQAARGAVRA